FILKILDRRPTEMPGQAARRRTAHDNLIANERTNIMHGVTLRRDGVLPRKPEQCQTALHLPNHRSHLFAQPVDRRITPPDDMIPVIALAFGAFASTGDGETSPCGGLGWNRIAKRVKHRRLRWLIDRTHISATDRINTVPVNPPTFQRA